MKCAEPKCQRAAEVVVHVGELAVAACMSDGVRIARVLLGRVVLLGRPGVELTIRPRGA